MDEEVVVEDDQDEEEKIWEEEQFRKRLGKRVDDGVSGSVARVHSAASQPKGNYYAIARCGLQQALPGAVSMGEVTGVLQGSTAMSINEWSEIAHLRRRLCWKM